METIYGNANTRKMRQLLEYSRRLSLKRNQENTEANTTVIFCKEKNEQLRAK
jgi:hypothetical protein